MAARNDRLTAEPRVVDETDPPAMLIVPVTIFFIIMLLLILRYFAIGHRRVAAAAVEEANAEEAATISRLEALPVSVFSAADESERIVECSICCESFAVGDSLRHLPCSHCFHLRAS